MLIDEKTRAFLEEPHFAVMATVNRDGRKTRNLPEQALGGDT